MGLFDNLYGGGQQYGDLVGDPAREEAKRRALLAITSQLLQAGGPSRLPVSTGQAIGGALQAGQGASDEAYKSAVEAAVIRHRMQPQAKDRGRLVMVAGPDGKPVYQYEDQAAGQSPYVPQTGKQDNIGSYQPDNYTEESWAKFIKDGNPADLKRYTKPADPYQPDWKTMTMRMPDGSEQTVTIDQKQGPNAKPIPFGASKPPAPIVPTDTEKVAAGFHSRMVNAEGLLGGYIPTSKDFMASQAMLSGGPAASIVANSMLSPEGQRYYQAAADWVRAKLRKESGAVIGPKEMSDEIRTYFPLPNDDPGTAAQKKAARDIATKAMEGMAGKAMSQDKSGAPKVGEVRKGYKFIGGDPANKANWEKQ